MHNHIRNIKIAEYLGLPSSYSIRRVEEWNTVYFVVPVVGRPTFVSKAAIDGKPNDGNHIVVSLDSVRLDTLKCKVLAVTKPRPNRFAGTLNTGVLLMEINTREQFWIRHYRYQEVPLRRGDIVQFDTKWQSVSDVLYGNRNALQNV